MADEEIKKIERIKRAPAVETKIKDLKNVGGGRVRVSGTVVSKNPELYSFVLDDSEGKVLVLTNDLKDFEKVSEGQFVCVFGKTWGEGDEIELQADIIQDLSKIDKDLYLKLR